MDRIVCFFRDGTVDKNGDFHDMNEEVATFTRPPLFSELTAKARSYVVAGCRMRLRGRFDAGGGGRAHYVVMNLSTDEDWSLYKQCLASAQVQCAEVIVDGLGAVGVENEAPDLSGRCGGELGVEDVGNDVVNEDVVVEPFTQGAPPYDSQSPAYDLAVVNNDFS